MVTCGERRPNCEPPRIVTVYLARMPESLQVKMTKQLKPLIVDVQKGSKRRPRLCYVTDAGSNECCFYNKVLRHLAPLATGSHSND